MTKTKMIAWLISFYKASNQLFWYGTTYETNDECLKAIEADLKGLSKDEVYNDHYRQYCC